MKLSISLKVPKVRCSLIGDFFAAYCRCEEVATGHLISCENGA